MQAQSIQLLGVGIPYCDAESIDAAETLNCSLVTGSLSLSKPIKPSKSG